MKKLLLAIFIITGFAACKSNSDLNDQNRNIQLLSDSSAYNNNVFSDTTATVKAEAVPAKISEKPRTIVRTKSAAKSPIKMQPVTAAAPVSPQTGSVPPVVATTPISPTPSTESTTVDKSAGAGNSGVETASTGTTKVQKKGMSKATQGAIIGGVAGAVGGAIISKKKGVGAVVGGIVGAAGGYIIGKNKDKKDNKFMIE
jgi:hypothetical protein